MNSATLNHLIPLQDVPPRLPRCTRGRPVDVGTIRRWALKGKRGVRLQTWCVGRVRCTTLAALDEFFRSTSAEASQDSPVGLGSRPSPLSQVDTYDVLERGGFLTEDEAQPNRKQRGRVGARNRKAAGPAPP